MYFGAVFVRKFSCGSRRYTYVPLKVMAVHSCLRITNIWIEYYSAFDLLHAALPCVIGRRARGGRYHVADATQPIWSAKGSPHEDLQGVEHVQRAFLHHVLFV